MSDRDLIGVKFKYVDDHLFEVTGVHPKIPIYGDAEPFRDAPQGELLFGGSKNNRDCRRRGTAGRSPAFRFHEGLRSGLLSCSSWSIWRS